MNSKGNGPLSSSQATASTPAPGRLSSWSRCQRGIAASRYTCASHRLTVAFGLPALFSSSRSMRPIENASLSTGAASRPPQCAKSKTDSVSCLTWPEQATAIRVVLKGRGVGHRSRRTAGEPLGSNTNQASVRRAMTDISVPPKPYSGVGCQTASGLSETL